MEIGAIKKIDKEKIKRIPFEEMKVGDSVDIYLTGIQDREARDYHTLINKAALVASGPEEKYGARSPGFSVEIWRSRDPDQRWPIIHVCRRA